MNEADPNEDNLKENISKSKSKRLASDLDAGKKIKTLPQNYLAVIVR